MDVRDTALMVLKVAAWSSMAGGVFLFVYFAMVDVPGMEAYDGWIALASLFSGATWWAVLLSHAHVAEESRQLHHEIMKAMK